MFGKRYKTIILVHNDEICWVSNVSDGNQRRFYRLPLAQVLDEAATSQQMPEWANSGPILCIIPDHWFGCASFAFRSRKPALIDPFLERKLSAANPGLKDIRHFFNYRYAAEDRDGELSAIYLQDDSGYRLYDALCKLNQPPQRITSPAFVWEERLEQCDREFSRLGSLLIHMTDRECQLYFYFRGKYQFSRSVVLADPSGGLEALSFEINQSLYMFSQKAKSELDRIYLVCDAPECQARLGESLGREITDLPALSSQWPEAIKIPGLEALDGLLQPSQFTAGSSFFSVVHRQIKQALEWRPVQLAGIISGLILLFGLVSESVFLGKLLSEGRAESQSIQQLQVDDDSAMALPEYAEILGEVLNSAAQSALVEKAYRIPGYFAPEMSLKQLDLALESPAVLKLKAYVRVRDAQELALVLTGFITRMRENFQGAASLGLDDIDITLDQPGNGVTANRYQIEFQLELS